MQKAQAPVAQGTDCFSLSQIGLSIINCRSGKNAPTHLITLPPYCPYCTTLMSPAGTTCGPEAVQSEIKAVLRGFTLWGLRNGKRVEMHGIRFLQVSDKPIYLNSFWLIGYADTLLFILFACIFGKCKFSVCDFYFL